MSRPDDGATTRPRALRTALVLGRVSNLPTVWTNVLAGAALGGAPLRAGLLLPLALAMSALYVAGMYLNDYFDRAWDARHRPERPIPAGHVPARLVGALGAALMLAGLGTVAALAVAGSTPTFRPLWAALALAGLVLAYDLHHKNNPLSPLLMGLCRVGVYLTAGLAAATPARALAAGCGLLLAHLIGLSAIAKREGAPGAARSWLALSLVVPVLGLFWLVRDQRAAWAWPLPYAVATAIGAAQALGLSWRRRPARWQPDPRRAVPQLIATLSLLDAALLAACGVPDWLPWLAAAGFVATRAAQRAVPGT